MGFLERASQYVHRLSSRAGAALMAANDRLGGVPLLLKRTFDSYNAHDGTFLSVALAYFFLLTAFPLVLALIALGSYLLGTERARQAALAFVAQALPGVENLIASNISLVLKQRGPIGVLALLGLIYSASGLFGALVAAMDRAWACRSRPTLHQRLLSLGGVLAMAALFFLSVGFSAAYEALRRAAGADQGLRAFVDYNLVYGSLAAVIGLLAWFQLTGFIILLGAELSVQIAARRGRGPAAGVC